ncbi:hypothetical protein [Variovorax sp. PAMC26660]|uniref:hypothetical protein n=1 Tax=Variovorax sp. PAMC26660 TaxID=2762322 RepID=UPI00164DF372|nr:hypothetical protein [Variovorax sp. PAMC26660]QNK67227.1 hypothetical protein H7F35_29410 [Variovorax sp. PAMC26660]
MSKDSQAVNVAKLSEHKSPCFGQQIRRNRQTHLQARQGSAVRTEKTYRYALFAASRRTSEGFQQPVAFRRRDFQEEFKIASFM